MSLRAIAGFGGTISGNLQTTGGALAAGPAIAPGAQAGDLSIGRSATTAVAYFGSDNTTYLYRNTATSLQIVLNNSTILDYGSAAASTFTSLGPTLRLGSTDANPPIAQTLQVQGASGSNISAVNTTIIGSLSTGSGTSGDIIFQTGGTGAGAAVQNTATTALTIKGATQQCIFAGAIRINAAPTAVTHTVTITSAADSATNFGHVMAFNFNGTTYYVPCGSTQP